MTDTVTIKDTDLITLVSDAITAAIERDISILKNGRVERNFTAHLADEISRRIPWTGIVADPFYNKHLGATKRLGGKVIELDLAVHARNTDEANLVAIELETTNGPKENDLWKLEGLTSGLDGYGYQLGLFLVVGVGKKAGQVTQMRWYKGGKAAEV